MRNELVKKAWDLLIDEQKANGGYCLINEYCDEFVAFSNNYEYDEYFDIIIAPCEWSTNSEIVARDCEIQVDTWYPAECVIKVKWNSEVEIPELEIESVYLKK